MGLGLRSYCVRGGAQKEAFMVHTTLLSSTFPYSIKNKLQEKKLTGQCPGKYE